MKVGKINPNFLFPLIGLVILILALSQSLFNMVPAMGNLLDPFSGFVQNENTEDMRTSRLHIVDLGLSDSANVFFDNREVPHIYAKNTGDLYFAQGYITAAFRLWQMDFLSYAAAGRMSEIFSEGFLDYDRSQRRSGIPEAARESLTLMEKDVETNEILSAYTRGVNAYIQQLDYKKMPLEYKILGYKPEPWSNLKTVLIMKNMAGNLSGYEDDVGMTNLMLALGETKFNRLFPAFQPPITPLAGYTHRLPNAGLAYVRKPEYLDYSFLTSNPILSKSSYDPRLGSNSWAVSGKKTRCGFPILCSDPHLRLSLPAIWMEMQLSAPGVNVYGVSIPGVPAILIGFNENIAWGLTNGEDDAKDWYKMKITDDYKKYQMDGRWLDLKYRIEQIKRRGQGILFDTVYFATQGPIVSDRSFPGWEPGVMNYALKWGLHKPSNEIATFIKLNKAKNYQDFTAALKTYCSPIQNFTFACKDNDIAIYHQGSMPVKWSGQGRFVLDGTKSSHLYRAYIPEDSLPHLYDPACSYVIAANQHPTDNTYPYYYNGYYVENRANRIGRLLEKEDSFDIPKMEAMQLDNTNDFAVHAVPVLKDRIDANMLTQSEKDALRSLSAWKGTYDLNDKNAELFELWWKYIKEYTWDEFVGFTFSANVPQDYVLLDLIRDEPNSEYFHRQGTSGGENAADIVRLAFDKANEDFDKLKRTGKEEWGEINRVNIRSMVNFNFLSRLNMPSGGHPEAINAITNNVGPSWRMVVQLGDRPKAFGIYPGGESGNGASPHFDDFVDDWNKGKYYPLIFFMSIDEARGQHGYCWTLQ